MRRVLLVLFATWIAAAAGPATIVVCAPGMPGTTAEAQPTMDALARALERSAGRSASSVRAVYDPTEAGGVERLSAPESDLALVPLAFLLLHGKKLGLVPKLQVVEPAGAAQVWSLVARKGQVSSPASLDGWEITGTPGYAPAFVRGPILAGWGNVPASVRITFTARPLTALRKAASGEKIAVLLDRDQTAGLASLPFGKDLEVVAKSEPLPGTLLCTIRGRLPDREAGSLVEALEKLDRAPGGKDVLAQLRMVRFVPPDPAALNRAGRAFEAAAR